jgi:hypothetical protein
MQQLRSAGSMASSPMERFTRPRIPRREISV